MNNPWSKTCFMIDTLERGGAQRQLLLMARYLREHKLEGFTLIVFREPVSLLEDFRKEGVTVVEIRKHREIDPIFFFSLLRFLRTAQPRFVVTFLPTADMWGRLAAVCARVGNIGCSIRTFPHSYGLFKDWFLAAMDRLSSFIVYNSQVAKEQACKSGIHQTPARLVIYNGIESSAETSPVTDTEQEVIGLVARLVEVKDIGTLLQAFSKITGQHPAARLLIVGDGPMRSQLEGEAESLGIASRTDFVGEQHDVLSFIHRCSIGVLTSRFEGLSNVVMEYMNAGKPVVATRTGGNPELVIDGETGYLVAPGDDLALAARLHELLSNRETAVKMGIAGRQRIQKEFSVEKMVASWSEVLQRTDWNHF